MDELEGKWATLGRQARTRDNGVEHEGGRG